MSKVNESIIVKRAQMTGHSQASTTIECNYQNNYYGDKMCISREESVKK